jgi:hypothetical protein
MKVEMNTHPIGACFRASGPGQGFQVGEGGLGSKEGDTVCPGAYHRVNGWYTPNFWAARVGLVIRL